MDDFVITPSRTSARWSKQLKQNKAQFRPADQGKLDKLKENEPKKATGESQTKGDENGAAKTPSLEGYLSTVKKFPVMMTTNELRKLYIGTEFYKKYTIEPALSQVAAGNSIYHIIRKK